MTIFKKAIVSTIAIALILLVHLELLDNAGLEHTEQGLQRALVTYGVSRGLNGVISVVQGTELAFEPVGVGMTFTPGEILDPVNDLIERFSTIVLISGTAFGLQRVFLDIVATPVFSILVSLVVVAALIAMWWPKGRAFAYKTVLAKSAIILLIARFSVPIFAITGEQFYTFFLAEDYQESIQQLDSTKEQLEDLQQNEASVSQETEAQKEKGIWQSVRDKVRSVSDSLDIKQKYENIKNEAEMAAKNISNHTINLIVIFIFQTIILPLASVWLVLKAIKWVAVRPIE